MPKIQYTLPLKDWALKTLYVCVFLLQIEHTQRAVQGSSLTQVFLFYQISVQVQVRRS